MERASTMTGLLTIDEFRKNFQEKAAKHDKKWEVVGFYAPDGSIYPFGTDTKVLSTVFEALCAPIIKAIADEFGYSIKGADQTIYPDFTLTPPSGKPPRIAIDVKTTYRKRKKSGEMGAFGFTLGSYTSYLRSDGAGKNITYPYEQYGDHWVIGFLYSRLEGVSAKVYGESADAGKVMCPYTDVEYFIQDKYKIAGEKPGSGNTTNIGSFQSSNIQDFRSGVGPFCECGKEICDDYWRHYQEKAKDRRYTTLKEYQAWRKLKPSR